MYTGKPSQSAQVEVTVPQAYCTVEIVTGGGNVHVSMNPPLDPCMKFVRKLSENFGNFHSKFQTKTQVEKIKEGSLAVDSRGGDIDLQSFMGTSLFLSSHEGAISGPFNLCEFLRNLRKCVEFPKLSETVERVEESIFCFQSMQGVLRRRMLSFQAHEAL